VILGGHSLVSGGIWGLVDSLWCEWYESQLRPADPNNYDDKKHADWYISNNAFDKYEGRE
jgi:hypothetical protein